MTDEQEHWFTFLFMVVLAILTTGFAHIPYAVLSVFWFVVWFVEYFGRKVKR